jgi:hypothetical protein
MEPAARKPKIADPGRPTSPGFHPAQTTMKFNPLTLSVLTLVTVLAGCQSARESRIQEHGGIWAALTPAEQGLIRDGTIDQGFTATMVYMAIGRPNSTEVIDSPEGKMEIWTYKNFVFSGGAAVKYGVNAPGQRYAGGSTVSANAPGGASTASTSSGRGGPSVGELADAPMGTLILHIRNNRVVSIHASE